MFESIVKAWILAIISFSYCFYASAKLPKGILRLISLTPIVTLFLYLPLTISSAHLAAITAFFLAWLANFKLLLFAFDQPPLSPPPPTLLHFISLASLPVKLKQTTPSQTKSKPHQRSNNKPHLPKSILVAIKGVILALLFHYYKYKQHIHENVVLAMYCVHTYIEIEFILAMAALPARAIFGFELEPQFSEPYLATSLQDFWGHRWNLMVTSILRPTVYHPVRRISSRLLRPMWVSSPAIFAVFVVSGLMHELFYYYLTRVAPTWEVTCFFILHGVAVAVEVAVKKVVPGELTLHPAVSGPLTVVFVSVTTCWLFFPQLLRNGVDERFIGESSELVDFLRGLLPSRLALSL